MDEPWYVTAYDERYYAIFRDQFSTEDTQAEIDGVEKLLGLEPGARVLDLCCGFGRHSLELARRGYRVTGLDLSPHLLAEAKSAAAQEGLKVDWVQADMRDAADAVAVSPQFAAVVCLFSSFGIFDDASEEARVLEGMARVLEPGGRVLVDTVNREIMLRQWRPTQWRELEDASLILYRRRFDVETGIMHWRETVISVDGSRIPYDHQVRLWPYTELAGMLGRAGLTECRPFGAFSGDRYTWDSHRMIVTAQKGN